MYAIVAAAAVKRPVKNVEIPNWLFFLLCPGELFAAIKDAARKRAARR